MDRTIPLRAAVLLNWLGNIEAPKGYNTIYGNNQSKLPKPLTGMTVDEVLAAQPSWTKRFKSSATGRYQFMFATLKDLKEELKLRGTQVFSADLQDRLGFHLLRRRGYDKWVAGTLSDMAFALNIAREWASIPVLAQVQGQKRLVSRGQSYYAGDGLNKSLVKAAEVEEALRLAKAQPDKAPFPASQVTAIEGLAVPPPVVETVFALPDEPVPAKTSEILAGFQDSVTKLRRANPEQVGTVFRSLLQVAGGVLLTKGVMTGNEWEMISGPTLNALVLWWGIWARSDKSLMASAASVPAVSAVVVDSPAIEAKVQDFRVATLESASKTGIV